MSVKHEEIVYSNRTGLTRAEKSRLLTARPFVKPVILALVENKTVRRLLQRALNEKMRTWSILA